MIDLTRRNFLLGVASSGLLVLQPPALKLLEAKKLVAKTPELITCLITGVADGEVTYETTPGAHDILMEDFRLDIFANITHITPSLDCTIEAQIRTKTLAYIGRSFKLSLQANPYTFYRGNFFITSQTWQSEIG